MSPAATKVLQELAADEDRDIVCDGNACYCGDRRFARRTLNELLRLTALAGSGGDRVEYYIINSTGHALLRRPDLEWEINEAITRRVRFSIVADRVLVLST